MKTAKEIIYNLSYSPYFLFLCGAVPLAAAYISQYFYELHPCPLCMYQRYPFALLMVLGFLAMFIKNRKFRLSAIFLGILTLLVNCGIGFFHVGVEQKWWSSGDCSADLDMTSIESLKASLFNAPIVRCDEIQFQFLNISMAGWNVIYCFCAAIFFLRYFNDKYFLVKK